MCLHVITSVYEEKFHLVNPAIVSAVLPIPAWAAAEIQAAPADSKAKKILVVTPPCTSD